MEGRVVGSLTSVRSNCKEFGMTYGGKPLWSPSFRSTTLRGKENSPILDGVVSTDSTQLVKDPVSGKWRKVLRFVANPRVLKAAYLKIKSKPGNLFQGPILNREIWKDFWLGILWGESHYVVKAARMVWEEHSGA